ncbi:MAG: hypothetical protein HY238_20630 [Acidobacteria bacterium]|nr:hypothetical protein [Acidobacteriota bacterium]
MRYRIALILIVLLLIAPRMLSAQETQAKTPEVRAAELQAELSKSTYTAKRSVPMAEGIFVEEGRVVEALYGPALAEHGTAIAARKPATISKVALLDRAIQVYFADNKCSLLILTKGDRETKDLTDAQLLELAKQGIGALFTAKGETPAPAKKAT